MIFYRQENMNNYDKMIELKKLLNISDKYFIDKILIKKQNYQNDIGLLLMICKTGDIDYFIKTINYFNIDIKHFSDISFCSNIVAHTAISKNITMIIIVLNYLESKNCKLNEILYTSILMKLINLTKPNYYQYDEIIYEFINIGGRISGISKYTEYAERIVSCEKK